MVSHNFSKGYCSLFLLLTHQMCCILSSGTFSILLHSYSNPDGKAFNDDDCDIWPVSQCDVFFDFCLGFVNDVITDDSQCINGEMKTQTFSNVKALSFHQNENLGNGLKNPITINFENWKGSVTLRIRVWDEDELSKADLIDIFSVSKNIEPSLYQTNQYITKDLCDSNSCLRFGYKAECDYKYYGSNCSLLCLSLGGCENESKVICPDGKYGENCSKPCIPRNDSNAGYECSDQGQIICLPGWYGTFCNRTCVPRDDEIGHFKCDPTTGKKLCYPEWCGENCDRECSQIVASSTTPLTSSPQKRSSLTLVSRMIQTSFSLESVSSAMNPTAFTQTLIQKPAPDTIRTTSKMMTQKIIVTTYTRINQQTTMSTHSTAFVPRNKTNDPLSDRGRTSLVLMYSLLGAAIFSSILLILLVVIYRRSKYPTTRIRRFRRHLSSLSINGKEIMWLRKISQEKQKPKIGRKYSSLTVQDLEDLHTEH